MTEPLGPPRLITLHWTAGDYRTTYDDYHFCVRGDGTFLQTLSIKLKGGHTWRRNSGNIGISLCAMHPDNKSPVTAAQRETCARLVAELAGMFGLEISGTITLPELRLVGGQLESTGKMRRFPVVSDHATFARADGYYPDRWDIGPKYQPILRRARAIRAEILNGKRQNTLAGQVR